MRQSESVGNQRAPAPIARLCAACAANNLGFCGAFGRPPQQDDRARLPEIEASVHRVSARKVILRERDLYDVVPVLCEGWAACLLALPDGRRQILSFLLPGDYFSTAFLFEPAGQCVVEAITDVQYRTFKRTDLMDAIYRQPQLIQPLSKAWVTEKMQADQLALDLGRRSGHARIARLILSLAERLKVRGMMRGTEMEFPLRQYHIADATGLTTIHVNKVLAEFRRSGLVEIKDRGLTILDPPGLQKTALQ